MKHRFSTLLLMTAGLFLASADMAFAAEQRQQKIDDGWQFRLTTDDKGTPLSTEWTNVDLPHDWSITNDFTPDAATGKEGGYIPTGKGVYLKQLNIPDPEKGRRLLYLEGAYMNSQVKVNGKDAGGRPYGYSSYFVDITPYLQKGVNDIEITVDNSQQKNSRWYSGSGLYRHVWLYNLPEVAVEPWSLFVSTPEVSDSRAVVQVKYDLTFTKPAEDIKINLNIYDAEGNCVLQSPRDLKGITSAYSSKSQMELNNPSLWSPETPTLYTVKIDIEKDGKVIDSVSEQFGIRSIEYSAENGFKLNGKPMAINGGCVHHDHGILGARSYDAAEAHKVRQLKEAGFNAVRTSHNHPSPAFLTECDRQGLMVIDESFDCWRQGKNPHDYGEHIDKWWKEDIASLVKRDRNHPSIICWSTGNEILERKSLDAVMTARHLANECRRLDPTRPVTSALAKWDNDWEIFDPLAEAHDIAGYNYLLFLAESDHQRDPKRVIWQTESYPRDAFDNWKKQTYNPYIIGDFVWTAIDYLGESGIGRNYYKGEPEGEPWTNEMWPHHGASCGDIDLTGWRKPISHYRELLYNPDKKLYMSVKEPQGYKGEIKETMWSTYPAYESWNWPGHEGKPIDIEVISRYDKVRLYANGELVGEKPTGEQQQFKAVFAIPYQPGVIEARGVLADGSESEPVRIETADEPYAIRLTADRKSLTADNQDLAYVTAEIVDRKGRVVPIATDRVTFSVSGQGSLEATGSADMKDSEGYHRNAHKASGGRVAAVVKTTHKPGKITLSASAPGLKKASIGFRTTSVQ